MSANDPASNPTSQAVHRRLSRALADLGIAPQPIGQRVQPWSSLIDDIVVFGALSISTAARLATLLEDIAVRVAAPCGSAREAADHHGEVDDVEGDFVSSFDPVAPPYEPGFGVSQLHPRIGK